LQNPDEWAKNLFQPNQKALEIQEKRQDFGRCYKKAVFTYVLDVNEKVKKYDGMLFNSLVFIGLMERFSVSIGSFYLPTERKSFA